MNKTLKILILFLVIVVGVVFLLSQLMKGSSKKEVEEVINGQLFRNTEKFNLKTVLSDTTINLEKNFPYTKYFESANYSTGKNIAIDLATLINFNKGDAEKTGMFYSELLTNKLAEYLKPRMKNFSIDSFIYLEKWAEQFKSYSEVDQQNSIMHEIVYDYWMNSITTNLRKLDSIDQGAKFTFKYKYLRARCAQEKYLTSIGFSSTEKVMNNLTQQKWGYIIKRFFTETSIFLKIGMVLFLFLTLYGYICIIKQHTKGRKR
ncbi:MAG: hypothetical protein SGJ04_00145 [Bacteroidota bacterium]|nr:hypothetical protein [Bacteroidota bacterium]